MMNRLHQVHQEVITAYDRFEFATVYHQINNFCTVDLSAFYLDYAKDILYVEAENSVERRSVQTVIYDTLVLLVQLAAPILPHTTDEAWTHLPQKETESVFLSNLPSSTSTVNEALHEKWQRILAVRDHVLKALEEARNEKKIGKSLSAQVTIHVDQQTFHDLESLHQRLHQLFIVSKVTLRSSTNPGVTVHVEEAVGKTCDRCWNVREDVGHTQSNICDRCASVVALI
jgi:isoleucyl-tRNA synthetase